jgi:hypothetical protein
MVKLNNVADEGLMHMCRVIILVQDDNPVNNEFLKHFYKKNSVH